MKENLEILNFLFLFSVDKVFLAKMNFKCLKWVYLKKVIPSSYIKIVNEDSFTHAIFASDSRREA